MVEFRPTRGNVRALLKSRRVGQMLRVRAQPMAAKIQFSTPRSKGPGGGGTAASTKVEAPDFVPDRSRIRVRITQTAYTGRKRPRGGAAAPLQFGNRVTEQRSHMTRALGGG